MAPMKPSSQIIEFPTAESSGYVVREEPAADNPNGAVIVNASEITGRDIGRFIKFVERFGGEGESRRVIIGELRQIYIVGDGGDEVTLSIGTCDPHEYAFGAEDKILVYGNGVTRAPLSPQDEALDHPDDDRDTKGIG